MNFTCEDFFKAGLATECCSSCHSEADYADRLGPEWGISLSEVEHGEHVAYVCCVVSMVAHQMTDEDWAKVIACAKEREEEDGF